MCSILLLAACCAPAPRPTSIHFARLGSQPAAFDELRVAFEVGNPGYSLAWEDSLTALDATGDPKVVFVQRGATTARVSTRGAIDTQVTKLAIGDVVLLRPGQSLRSDDPIGALIFDVPEPFDPGLPRVIRPDQDPRITDTPGGCAEESDAYRRILLTWSEENGPYTYRSLNAHRVRIHDSFTHYHPVEGGFDEFYLVQGAPAGACLLTSTQTERIEARDPATVLARTELRVGDLVYMPRGTVHRGFGGVLAQVITVPGFRPGAEIGVDHHLRAISEATGEEVPYHEAASDAAVVK